MGVFDSDGHGEPLIFIGCGRRWDVHRYSFALPLFERRRYLVCGGRLLTPDDLVAEARRKRARRAE
jgi:hypothetical protein